jgi:hypothetical protein
MLLYHHNFLPEAYSITWQTSLAAPLPCFAAAIV